MTIPDNWRDLPPLRFGTPGPMRRELVRLVVEGTKTATAGLLDEFHADPDDFGPLPTPGLQLLVLGEHDEPVGVTTDTRGEIHRFADVPWEFARDEGEGFVDIQDWRVRHRRYWESSVRDALREQLRPDWELTDDTLVVCEWFDFTPLPSGAARP